MNFQIESMELPLQLVKQKKHFKPIYITNIINGLTHAWSHLCTFESLQSVSSTLICFHLQYIYYRRNIYTLDDISQCFKIKSMAIFRPLANHVKPQFFEGEG